jgi:hypothetical protein
MPMPKSPTPNWSLSGSIMPRTMFLSTSSTSTTSPSTHIGLVNKTVSQRGRLASASVVEGSPVPTMRRQF